MSIFGIGIMYIYFLGSIQVLRRGVSKCFINGFRKLCFCPLTLLFCAPPGFSCLAVAVVSPEGFPAFLTDTPHCRVAFERTTVVVFVWAAIDLL